MRREEEWVRIRCVALIERISDGQVAALLALKSSWGQSVWCRRGNLSEVTIFALHISVVVWQNRYNAKDWHYDEGASGMATKCSYSQNREDILLARALPHDHGFYIDVGAADPIEDSVTKYFYERDWRGINVEPQKAYYDRVCADRTRDVNLQAVVTDAHDNGMVTFHLAEEVPGWSTTQASIAEAISSQGVTVITQTVAALTLAELCEQNVPEGVTIDFLKIDVEGAERQVLLGADFKRWRPRIMLLEATEPASPTQNHHLWEDLILAADYTFATFDGLNRYYVRSEEPELLAPLQVPVNVFDDWYPHSYHRLIQERDSQLQELLHATATLKWATEELRREADRLKRETANTLYDTALRHRRAESMRTKLLELGKLMTVSGN
jgi:FkbM family methyltransferase